MTGQAGERGGEPEGGAADGFVFIPPIDAETADRLAAEAASMTDEELVGNYRRARWGDDPWVKRIMADDMADRLEGDA